MRRHELSEHEWKAVESHTLGRLRRGRDNRLFVNAVRYGVRTGISWRDLLKRFGSWNTVARRFRRSAQAGGWEALFQAVQGPGYAWVPVDATTVKAHKAAAGQKKPASRRRVRPQPRGLLPEAARGARGTCLPLVRTPGHWADCTQLPGLLAGLREPPGAVVADKAYGTNAVLAAIATRNAEPVIPPKTSRNERRSYDQNRSADRNKAERFFGRPKEAGGFAARYDKTAVSFLATAHLLAALDWLR